MGNKNILIYVLKMFFKFLKRVWGFFLFLLVLEEDTIFRDILSLGGESNCLWAIQKI